MQILFTIFFLNQVKKEGAINFKFPRKLYDKIKKIDHNKMHQSIDEVLQENIRKVKLVYIP